MVKSKFRACANICDARTGVLIHTIEVTGEYCNSIEAESDAMNRAYEYVRENLAFPRLSKKYSSLPVDTLRAMLGDGVIDFENLGYACVNKGGKRVH